MATPAFSSRAAAVRSRSAAVTSRSRVDPGSPQPVADAGNGAGGPFLPGFAMGSLLGLALGRHRLLPVCRVLVMIRSALVAIRAGLVVLGRRLVRISACLVTVRRGSIPIREHQAGRCG